MVKRHPKIQAIVDNLSKPLSGKTQAEAEADGTCPTCGKKLTRFRNAISEREYQISGMCQGCQDSVFGKD